MADAPREYLLVWWTAWFDEFPFENRLIENCGLPYRCRMTHRRDMYSKSKVILFHAQNMPGAYPLPNENDTLSGEKAWVLNSLEAPQFVEYDKHLTSILSHRWSTWRGSDFPDSYFQSGVDGLLKTVLEKPRVSLEEKNRRRKLPREQGGLAPVAWVVSNCHASNHRNNYVRELARHIDVDIYGHCQPNRPWPKKEDGTDMSVDDLIAPYKFYLSFENSNCEDYVTEKLYRPFLLGNVPVVDGPMNYSRFSPTENALIQTDNFANAGMLAKYLKHLDSDDEAYLSHLRYKVPKDPTHTPTLEDLSPSFVKEWYNEGRPEDWGIDGHGANCKICKFAHDLEEGIVKFDASKRIGIDNTCTLNKHAQVIVTNDDDLDAPVPSPPQSSPSPSPSQPPSLPDNSPYIIPSTDDSSNIRQSEGSSEGEWMYYFILPVLLLSIAILAVLFSRRLRRAFRNHQQSEDRDVLLDNMQP